MHFEYLPKRAATVGIQMFWMTRASIIVVKRAVGCDDTHTVQLGVAAILRPRPMNETE